VQVVLIGLLSYCSFLLTLRVLMVLYRFESWRRSTIQPTDRSRSVSSLLGRSLITSGHYYLPGQRLPSRLQRLDFRPTETGVDRRRRAAAS